MRSLRLKKIEVLERSFDYSAPTERPLALAVYATGSFARVPVDRVYRHELVIRGSLANLYTVRRAPNTTSSGAIEAKSATTQGITLGDVEAAPLRNERGHEVPAKTPGRRCCPGSGRERVQAGAVQVGEGGGDRRTALTPFFGSLETWRSSCS